MPVPCLTWNESRCLILNIACAKCTNGKNLMEYILVALMQISPGEYALEVLNTYRTQALCQQDLSMKRKEIDAPSLVCAKKDWN